MRLLLTRAEQDNLLLAEMLAQKGHQTISAPLLHIQHVPYQLPQAPAQDIIITSRHAVPAAAACQAACFYVVGEQTAVGLLHIGCTHIAAEAPDAAHLLPLLPDDGREYLYLSGKDIRCDFSQSLNNSTVTRVVVYEAAAQNSLPDHAVHALSDNTVDGVLFFSPRTAEIFHQLYPHALSDMTAFCLSAAVAEICETRGKWRDIIIAEQPTLAAMIHAIDTK